MSSYRSTCVSRYPVNNWWTFLEQIFMYHMPLMTATSTLGLERTSKAVLNSVNCIIIISITIKIHFNLGNIIRSLNESTVINSKKLNC